jgi:hypothetical protein
LWRLPRYGICFKRAKPLEAICALTYDTSHY